MLGVPLGMEELEQVAEAEVGLGVWASQRVVERLRAEDAEEREQVRRGQEGWLKVKTAELNVSVLEKGCPLAQEGVREEKVEEEVVEKAKMKMQGMMETVVEANEELLLERFL